MSVPELDFKSPRNLQDPFPLYARLRDHDPVHWSDELGGWVVSRYEDVLRVFDQPGTFSSDRFRRSHPRYASDREPVRAVARVLSDWLVFRDPPDHTRLRGLLQKSFTPRHLDRNRWGIQKTIDDLLDRVADRGEMDFIRDFAFPLPALVIAILLGAPTSDIESIKRWSDQLALYLGGAVAEQDNFTEAESGLSKLVEYFRALTAERAREPRDDLMSLMLRAENEGETLSSEEVVSNCVLLLFAGHETTTNLLGNGLHHLLRHPAELERLHALRDRPEAVAVAVEELLRFDAPVPATAKVALRDLEWHGAKIREGDRVLPFMSSANRDPQQFERADALDVTRRPNRHLSFSFGIHFCLGAPLARLEAGLAFATLLRRLPEPCAGPAEFKPQIFLRGLRSLPLRWDAHRAV
jgi:cytochrome P450